MKFIDLIENMVVCAGAILGITPDDVRFTVALMHPQVGAAFEAGHGEAGLITVNAFQATPFARFLPLHYVVAHEMWHCKQWLDGRLVHAYDIKTREPFLIWEGEEWKDFDSTDQSLPWEREASHKMFSLGDQMVEHANQLIANHESAA